MVLDVLGALVLAICSVPALRVYFGGATSAGATATALRWWRGWSVGAYLLAFGLHRTGPLSGLLPFLSTLAAIVVAFAAILFDLGRRAVAARYRPPE